MELTIYKMNYQAKDLVPGQIYVYKYGNFVQWVKFLCVNANSDQHVNVKVIRDCLGRFETNRSIIHATDTKYGKFYRLNRHPEIDRPPDVPSLAQMAYAVLPPRIQCDVRYDLAFP
jgi:hypothetical protein